MVACSLTSRATGAVSMWVRASRSVISPVKVLVQRAVFWADQRREARLVVPVVAATKGISGRLAKGLCDVFQVFGGPLTSTTRAWERSPKALLARSRSKKRTPAAMRFFDSPSRRSTRRTQCVRAASCQ